jgi:DNA polymerase type B, organellar and viral/RNase_H superfamily
MKATIKNLFIICMLIIIVNYLTLESDILNILYLTTPIISKKFNLKGDLNKDKLYHNLYDFLKRIKEDFIKMLIKITVKDHHSKSRIISITKYVYIDCKNKNDIQSVLTYTISKFRKYMDHYHPISINGLFVDYVAIDNKEYSTQSVSNPWIMSKVDLETFSFPLTVEYEKLADKIDTSNSLYTEYSQCKGFKDSKNTEFRVSKIFEDDKIVIYIIHLSLNKELYNFNDILNKDSGVITRKFPEGTIITNEGFKIETISNENKITPIKPNLEGVINSFQALTLDIETWLNTNSVQNLLSVAFYNGKNSKFYFITDYSNELELVEAVLNDILLYNNYNIYIHNGANFDLIFLLNKIVELKDKLGLQFDVIYKDGEFLNINLSNGKNTIAIKDSYKMTLSSLENLAGVFGIEEEKGKFPFDFAKPETFNYVGNTPEYKYYAFNNKSIISREEYNFLVKENWNFKEELAKYNINDCVVLYKIMEKFYDLIQNEFNLDMKNNPTLSSLAFYLYTSNYIPDNLLISNSETIKTKTGKIIITEKISSKIDNLSSTLDSYIRNSYFGGHVDSYIPHFDNSLLEFKDQVLYQYDVVSLYPYVMKTFGVGIPSYIVKDTMLDYMKIF